MHIPSSAPPSTAVTKIFSPATSLAHSIIPSLTPNRIFLGWTKERVSTRTPLTRTHLQVG